MLDSAPDGGDQREPPRDSGTPSLPTPGLTPFLVNDPTTAQASREELSEAVRALIRERDYLREVREVQLSEHAAALAEQREQVQAIRRLYGSERRAFREQLEASNREVVVQAEREDALRGELKACRQRVLELEQELAAHRVQAAAQLHEFDTYRAQTAALQPELAEHRAQAAAMLRELDAHRDQATAVLEEREALLQGHDALQRDRDAWRERATHAEALAARSPWARLKRSLSSLVRRARPGSPALRGAAPRGGPSEP